MDYNFSRQIASLQPSAIREILKATADPDVIPFAAGNPAPEAFPVDDIRRIAADILASKPVEALQYGITEGYYPLRERILKYMKQKHSIGGEGDGIIITSGATQVMDIVTRAFVNEGDAVICENPSFIGSLNCFRSHGAKLIGVETQSDGMNIQSLEDALKKEKKAKFIYIIPNFQNPSGATTSLEKRKQIYELAEKYDVLILEDNPYGDLRVCGGDIPSIKSLDGDGRVIYAGSFSKILAPGIRVGYVIANSDIIPKLTVAKQTSDTHTPMFSQMLVNGWMSECDFEGHIKKIRDIYKNKLELMCRLIDSEMGDFVSYNKPEGGLFVWCRLPESVDMPAFVRAAVEKKVAVVPGSAFMVSQSDKTQCIRLNFSTPTDEKIEKGMRILGEVRKQF